MVRILRRRFLIDRLQCRLILTHFTYSAFIVMLFGGVLFYPLVVELRSVTEFTTRSEELSQIFLSFHERFWPAAGVLLVLMTIHWVVITHRVVGPLYRFRQIFDAVQEGDFTAPAKIRKDDYLHKESEHLGAMVSALRAKITDIRDLHRESEHLLRVLGERVADGNAEEIHKSIANLEVCLETLRVSIDHFKLGVQDDSTPAPEPREAPPGQESTTHSESEIRSPA